MLGILYSVLINGMLRPPNDGVHLETPQAQTAKFKTLWRTKFAVLMARERGRIGSDAAFGDMPKRLQAHSYDEMNEGPAR